MMMYKAVQAGTLEKLNEEVTKGIEIGFRPIGSLIYQAPIEGQSHRFIQTMFQFKEDGSS